MKGSPSLFICRQNINLSRKGYRLSWYFDLVMHTNSWNQSLGESTQLPLIDYILSASLIYPPSNGLLVKSPASLQKLVHLHFIGKCVDLQSRVETAESLLYQACLLNCYYDRSIMLSFAATGVSSAALKEGLQSLTTRAVSYNVERHEQIYFLLNDVLDRFERKINMTFG